MGGYRDLLPFPTRRSSDPVGYRWRPLSSWRWLALGAQASTAHMAGTLSDTAGQITWWTLSPHLLVTAAPLQHVPELTLERSEEHTSELQSRPHLVCRLLLE